MPPKSFLSQWCLSLVTTRVLIHFHLRRKEVKITFDHIVRCTQAEGGCGRLNVPTKRRANTEQTTHRARAPRSQIMFLIIVSSITLPVENPSNRDSTVLFVFEVIFTVCFTVELVVKVHTRFDPPPLPSSREWASHVIDASCLSLL